MKIKLILFCLTTNFLFAQQNESIKLPSPKIGWDSLEGRILYPELARRAGVWGAYEAKLIIDSVGNVSTLKVGCANFDRKPETSDTIFINSIKNVLKEIEWNPGLKNGKSQTMSMTIPLVFSLVIDDDIPRTIIIKVKARSYKPNVPY
jgi:hypothetical protein